MPRLILLAVLAGLVGCAPKINEIAGAYRQASAPIYSAATLNEARLIGQWAQVGAFGAKDCGPGRLVFSGAPDALFVTYRLCLSGAEISGNGPMQRSGPGRYRMPGLGGELWLLWVDTEARTLLFGTPSGAYGFVLNRGGPLPADRAQALRAILDWNGYDADALTLW